MKINRVLKPHPLKGRIVAIGCFVIQNGTAENPVYYTTFYCWVIASEHNCVVLVYTGNLITSFERNKRITSINSLRYTRSHLGHDIDRITIFWENIKTIEIKEIDKSKVLLIVEKWINSLEGQMEWI